MTNTCSLPEYEAVREAVGIWLRDDYTFFRFEGADVASWLQTQTTSDVRALASGEGQASALLDRKGRLQAHFTVHRWQDEYWLIVEKQQVAQLLAHLENHLFLEDVRISDAGPEVDQVLIQGPKTLPFLASLLDAELTAVNDLLPLTRFGCHPIELLGRQVLLFLVSETGEDGYLLVVEAGRGRMLLDELLAQGAPHGAREIGPGTREVLRIEAGIPRFGVDMDSTNRIPETTLEREAVSYDKGCYLGQEVVAKLRAYSSVKRALVGLVLDPGERVELAIGSMLYLDNAEIGEWRSSAVSPRMQAQIALAYLDRDHRAPGQMLELRAKDAVFHARVVVLPFYAAPSREQRARACYEDALVRFERDEHDQDHTAIELLKEAALLDPAFEDAYEALGVILHRHHRVDEAIRYMQVLERLNPDSVMAHTNLSVFYVAKGMIAEAEEEKAKAAVLQIRHARGAQEAEALAAAERERIRHEATERISMFEEVLELDPDDPLATFGMGMAHVQLGEYARAIPYLTRAATLQKEYSVAYLNLGKCHEFLDHVDEACAAYHAGIAAASRKGDLMPLREMERRLRNLLDRANATLGAAKE
jgi:folate-binding protein YgfZ